MNFVDALPDYSPQFMTKITDFNPMTCAYRESINIGDINYVRMNLVSF